MAALPISYLIEQLCEFQAIHGDRYVSYQCPNTGSLIAVESLNLQVISGRNCLVLSGSSILFAEDTLKNQGA